MSRVAALDKNRPNQWLVGIFVGGESRRMGQPKGLLPAPSEGSLPSTENLVERLGRVVAEAMPGAPLVLVGQRSEYVHLPWPALADVKTGCGPLGGLVALLNEAERSGLRGCLALGCDFPFLSAELLARLFQFDADCAALAPFSEGYFQPLVARYRTSCAAAARDRLEQGLLSLQHLLVELGCTRLPLEAADEGALRDWDEPADLL